LKTKETKTLPIKGLQPPAVNQSAANSEAAPNAEEIKLPLQKLRAGDGTISINIDLPAGYHLNPTAPRHYKISIENGAKSLAISDQDAARSTKDLQLPIRVPGQDVAGGHGRTARIIHVCLLPRRQHRDLSHQDARLARAGGVSTMPTH